MKMFNADHYAIQAQCSKVLTWSVVELQIVCSLNVSSNASQPLI